MESASFDLNNHVKKRESVVKEKENNEGNFYAILFKKEKTKVQNREFEVKEVKVNKTKKQLIPMIVVEKVAIAQTDPILINVREEKNENQRSKSPVSNTRNLNPKSKERLVKTTRDISTPKNGRTQEKTMKINVQEIVDRLHPKTQIVNSPIRTWENKLRAKDYYIDHPDLYKEMIYRMEGKPKNDKTMKPLMDTDLGFKVVRVDKNK